MKQLQFIRHSNDAFTLIDLLAVCAVIGILVLTLGPALARSNNSQTLQCMNNHRQLYAVWRMHADDNNDRIVYASDDGSTATHPQNTNAWTWSHMDSNGNNRGNWDTNYDIVLRPLWPYMGHDASLFRCPSDRSSVVASGQVKPRVRSVSMNTYLGGFAGTDGGWGFGNIYRIYLKVSEITVPEKIFVFLDQRADSISWGNFLTWMNGYPNNPAQYQLTDFPGFYHDQSCTFSFLDGHVEEKRWVDARTTPPPTGLMMSGATVSTPDNLDVAWLQDHATRPK
jgi:prepilin-type processing-associated H-X9-DG protein